MGDFDHFVMKLLLSKKSILLENKDWDDSNLDVVAKVPQDSMILKELRLCGN